MSIPRFLSNLAGTLRDSLRIGRATLDASGLTAARTHTLPDRTGTLVPSTKAEVDILRMTNVVYVDDDTSAGAPPQLLDLSNGASNWYSGFHFKRTTGTESYGYFEGVLGGSSVENGLMFFVSVDPASLEKKVLMHDSATPAAPEQTIITPDGENLFVEAGMCVWLRYVYDATLADPGYWVVDSVAQVRSFTGSDGVTVDTSDSAVVAIRGLSHRVDDITAASGDIRFLLDKTPYQGRLAIYDDSGARMKLADLTGTGKQRFLAAPASGGEVYTVDYMTEEASPGATVMDDAAALAWSPTYPDGELGDAYDYTPSAATGGTGGYSYAVTSGSVPPGLTFVGSSGRLHGTPTDDSGSPYAFDVLVTDSMSDTAGNSQSVDIIDNSDPYWADVSSLLYGDSATADETGKTWTVSGTVTVDTGDTQFGLGVLTFPSGTLELSTGDDDEFDFGGGDVTIQFRFKLPVGASGVRVVYSKRAPGADDGLLIYFNGRKLSIAGQYNSGLWDFNFGDPSDVSVDAWHSAAVVRSGDTWSIWIDESVVAAQFIAGSIPNNSAPPRISESGFVLGDAKLAQWRVTKGVARDVSIAQTDAWPNS